MQGHAIVAQVNKADLYKGIRERPGVAIPPCGKFDILRVHTRKASVGTHFCGVGPKLEQRQYGISTQAAAQFAGLVVGEEVHGNAKVCVHCSTFAARYSRARAR